MNEVALRANDVLRNDVGLRPMMLRFAQTDFPPPFSPSGLEKHRKMCYNKTTKGGTIKSTDIKEYKYLVN
jgi:hypothetical protein